MSIVHSGATVTACYNIATITIKYQMTMSAKYTTYYLYSSFPSDPKKGRQKIKISGHNANVYNFISTV